MTTVVEFPEQLEEVKDSHEDNSSQDQTVATRNDVMAIKTQLENQGKGGPSFLWETLTRQFLEYEKAAAFLCPEEQQRQLLAFLARFLKAWDHSDSNICFPNMQLLASETSKFLVKEMKKKLNGKSAEEARTAVWQFLQWQADEAADGYLLLRSIYLLSFGHLEQGIRWNIIKSGLPVMLLQCLNLFFFFPLEEAGGKSGVNQDDSQTQEMFVQTMLNIYAEEQAVEELLVTEDLQSLIIATASLWDQGSPSWKRPTSKVLQKISSVQSKNIISYLQATDCVKISIQNLSKLADSLPTCDICEAVNIILCFVKDSYRISPALLLEFENNGGYQLLMNLLLRYEGLLSSKEDASLRETLDFLTQLTVCGKTELKVSGNVTNPQLPQFNAKQALSSENRVRNLKAFQVLESLFRKTANPKLCQHILLAIKSIWMWDSMNFFLLEWSLQPISQFVGVIHLKPPIVQAQFFELVESVVFDLLYIPHEILKEIQCLIKENAEPGCTSCALCCLHRITQKDLLFTDIFRDSGLLGMLLAQLRKEAKILIKKGGSEASCQDQSGERSLISMMLKMVVALVMGSVRNTVILRDYGMVPYIKIFLDNELYRSDALTILEQLSVINAEEYMSIIIGALCSSTQGELCFILDLLKSLLRILENPKGRSAFRTSSGFNGLLSLLADMEGALQDPPSGLWASCGHSHMMELILHILQVIAAALYMDPINSNFFQKNGLFEKMAEDLGLLGCFSAQKWGLMTTQLSKTRSFAEFSEAAVCSSETFPIQLKSCISIFSFLDYMAKCDPFKFKSCLVEIKQDEDQLPVYIQKVKENREEPEDSFGDNDMDASLWTGSKDKSKDEDGMIVCPGAFCIMVKLLCKLYHKDHPELSWEIQYAVANHIQSLMKSEKSRQVACGAGLLDAIITSCLEVLHNTSNPLHLPVIRLFEKLASQSIEPDVLRKFLCFGIMSPPLASGFGMSQSTAFVNCRNSLCQAASSKGSETAVQNGSANDHQIPSASDTSWISNSSAMAFQTSMSLISMTTPRNLQPQSSCLTPSFVEFDMSFEGYGCLFLSSLATILGSSAEYSVSGGTGKVLGTRMFPPLDGLTFSSWFLVSKMGSVHNPHPLRFLTLVRHMARTEEEFVCFVVSFSPMDRSLSISTEEMLFQTLDMMEPEMKGHDQSSVLSQVQFECADLLATRQWHHLAVTVARETRWSCTVSAYIDGQKVGSAKMQYIQPLPGTFVSMDPSSFIDVYGYVATPPIWKQKSSLTWRQGPVYLFEEVISMENLQLMIRLGPRYCSNFQAVDLREGGSLSSVQTTTLVTPEKISFGISAMRSSYTTVKEIKDCYGEVDARLIAKELRISSRDNATPIFMAHNTAENLPGPLRTIGAVIVGSYSGTRVFQPSPAAISLNYIGGPAILLGLLAMANDDHTMYAAVKVLQSVLSNSATSENLMKQVNGYQILAYLLKRKAHMLNSRILQLALSIGGIADTSLDSITIRNFEVFQNIVCNFELWCNAPENLDFALFSHLIEILQSSRDGSWNMKLARQVQIVPKLVLLCSDPEITCSRVSSICAVLSHLLQNHFSVKDFLWIGLFLVYTLRPSSVDESQTCPDNVMKSLNEGISQTSTKMIWLRNQLLNMLLDVIQSNKFQLSSEIQEEAFHALGPDWFLMFIQGHVHPSTAVLAVRLLLHFLQNRALLRTFTEGMMAGLWIENNTVGLNVLMNNLKSHQQIPEHSPYLLSGFAELKAFLSHWIHVPEMYFFLSGLFLATPVTKLPDETKTNLDSMLQWLLRNHHADAVTRIGLCLEAGVLLLEMIKSLVNQTPTGTEDSWQNTYPGHIMQFFCLVYHMYSQDPLWYNSDFLQALALIVFPLEVPQGSCWNGCSPSGLAVASCNENCAGLPPSLLLNPAKKQVWDFIRLLLMETLLLSSAHEQWHPLEFLLEASAENSTTEQKRYFQTELLLCIIDVFHITIQDDGGIMKGNGDGQSASETVMPFLVNVSYFIQRLVEKLYAGMLDAEPMRILLFLTEHLTVVTKKDFLHKEASINALYNSLNRTILYYLSSYVSEQQRLLEVLHTLQLQWDIIFSIHNSSLEFITCLLYCLLLLKTTSSPEDHKIKGRELSDYSTLLSTDEEERMVQQKIQKAIEEIWIQLLSQKGKILEDAYKISLSVQMGDGDEKGKIVDMTPVWKEIVEEAWHHFLASEKKNSPKSVQGQYSRKIISWSGSLSSAAKTTFSKNIKQMGTKAKDFVSCLEEYRRHGQELYAILCKDHAERLLCAYNKSAKAWTNLEEQLFGKGGPWGPVFISSKWILDGYEGPARMRKRTRLNITCPTALPVRNKLSNFPLQAHQTYENASLPEKSQEELILNEGKREMDCDQLTFFPSLCESFNSEELLEVCMERNIILQEFVEDEKIRYRQSVVIVQGHLALEGVLLFGQQHFYICKYFTLSHLEEVYCSRHCLSSISDSFIYSLCHKEQAMGQPTCSCYSYCDIKEIQPMRFLLQKVAFEIFFRNGYSIFLVFHNNDRKTNLKRFYSVRPDLKSKGVTEESINIRRSAGKEKPMLLKWQRREISNFEYLMYLNTLAGRTYSDLMQYPVFPWILADYHSQILDLNNPSTFRDLSKPMGAQTLERKMKFIQRYKEVENNEGNLSVQCHYCTHYSSAMIVASYLVRIEPFSQIFCSLQGGSFDVAERMFHSIQSAWESASRDNMTDVRELIPEFFYFPEFLTNCNQFELGSLQDGTSLGDIQLPPWAEGNPYKFVSLHRQALESDYVSAHLHHWIDLIFGSKQQGPAAVKAVNIFHPYFYGDQLQLDNIKDPLIKNTILGFVSNFGQIPKQLFTKPHPTRNALGKHPVGRENILFPCPAGQLPPSINSLHNLKFSSVTVKEAPQGPIGHVVCTEKGIWVVGKNKILLPPLWNKVFCWGFHDFTCCLTGYGSDKISTTFEAFADWGCCLCAVCPAPTTLITSGSSSVVCVWELSMARDGAACLCLKKPLYGHTQPVTCLAASTSYSIIVSGSTDRSCIIWDLNHLTHITQLPAHEACLSAVAINDSTGDIASCAGTILYLWNVNGQPLARASLTSSLAAIFSCCCFTEVIDWDVHGIIVTGDTAGGVQVWKVENTSHPYRSFPMSSQEDFSECQPNKGNKVEMPLVLCQELDLSMSPSEKPGKIMPAVTTIAVSRNYSKILAGNEHGKIHCWSADE
uniref:WD repeat- and FYVE domain-containing protein 4 isoform X1 n=1 Tax=Pogona vitticeps TaxID=103695 RepID=A0ABM5FZY4_9SAUR